GVGRFGGNGRGADGKPRPLHIDASLACIDFSRGPVDKVTPRIVPAADGADQDVEELVNCAHFVIRRHALSQPITIPADDRCRVMMGLSGKVECLGGDGTQSLDLGETVLIPAAALPARVAPQSPSVVLEVFWE